MCDHCDKLKGKISHKRFDALTKERIKALISDLERQKQTMHA
jgi:hypothetical protein